MVWVIVCNLLLCVVIGRCLFCIWRYRKLLEGIAESTLLWSPQKGVQFFSKRGIDYLNTVGVEKLSENLSKVSVTRSLFKKEQLYITAIPCGKRWWILFSEERTGEERLDQEKCFIANACHELRTPITIIKGFTETLQEMPQITEDMQKIILEKIQKHCSRLENVVTHSLVLADLDRKTPVLCAPCDLVVLVDKCCQMLIALHPECHIEHFHKADTIAVMGDMHLLELAIMNVLQNSVKYSEGPAHIVVCIDHKEDIVSLSIADRGVGIPQGETGRIFDRFYKVRTVAQSAREGAGLGLSIVQKVMQRHKASLECTSQEGRGTTIAMRFRGIC